MLISFLAEWQKVERARLTLPLTWTIQTLWGVLDRIENRKNYHGTRPRTHPSNFNRRSLSPRRRASQTLCSLIPESSPRNIHQRKFSLSPCESSCSIMPRVNAEKSTSVTIFHPLGSAPRVINVIRPRVARRMEWRVKRRGGSGMSRCARDNSYD